MSKGWLAVTQWSPGEKTGERKEGGVLSLKGSRQPEPHSGIHLGGGKCPSHEQDDAAVTPDKAGSGNPPLYPHFKKVSQLTRLLFCPSH